MKPHKKLTTLLALLLSLTAQANEYRAWGMGGDSLHAKAEVTLNGVTYVVLPFSDKSIPQTEASTSGDVTTLMATLKNNETSKEIQVTISQDYLNSSIVLKAYNSTTEFNEDTLKAYSSEQYLEDSGTYINVGTINIEE